ncbi:hypothetical protein [Pseudarthrobacter sp. efr-133-R2A-89]|nr:hypothetical protein [Pseudarthrobacter sp. efr-133-R2A-89]
MNKFLAIIALAVVLIVGLNIVSKVFESESHSAHTISSISAEGLSSH